MEAKAAWEDEARVVAACREGDERAWAELYAACAPRVAAFLQRLAGRGSDVEDLVQQVFVECFTAIRGFRGDAPVLSWLFGIAANVARRHLRGARRRGRKAAAFGEHLTVVGADVGADPSGRVVARDTFARIEGALATLKMPQRIAWLMVEVEGMSSEEVARATGSRASTVRARLKVARESVRRALEQGTAPVATTTPGPEVVTR